MDNVISQRQYDSHDCHKTALDGCNVCERWFAQERQSYRLWGHTASELNLINVRHGAFMAYQAGYYTFSEYLEFCAKNKILAF